MKKMLISSMICFFMILFCSQFADASPFLVCDPDTSTNQPTFYKVKVDTADWVNSLAQSVSGGVRLYYDVASINLLQTHQFSVYACKTNSVGVEVCSATASNFTYPAPVAPGTPSGVRLEQ